MGIYYKIDEIKEKMRIKRFSQAYIAEKIEVSQPSVSKSLQGRRSIGERKLSKLCRILGINTKKTVPNITDDLNDAIKDLLAGKGEEQVKELTRVIRSIKRL